MLFQANISSPELENLPIRIFEGKVIVIDNPGQVEAATEYLSQSPILGFDTETRPSFVKGKKNKVALLQLANHERAYLFRLGNTGMPDELVNLLQNKEIIKVGAAVRDDIKALNKISDIEPGNFVDLQKIAKMYGILEMSVRKLAAIVLGVRISKAQQLSNWENKELTEAQRRYAATDAWICREIYMRLNKVKVNSLF